MRLTVAGREIRPLTADDAMQMVRAGILGEEERVELLDGVLTAMSPQDPPHAVVVQRLTRWLAPVMVAGTHDVRVQLPFGVPDPTSLPEPDVAVVGRGGAAVRHPVAAALIVEVAFSSHATDLGRKTELYAAAGVPEYWVVNVPHRAVHVHLDPLAGGYRQMRTSKPPETVRPVAVDVAPLGLVELFAGT
jgi:Uma2 family endonuclease